MCRDLIKSVETWALGKPINNIELIPKGTFQEIDIILDGEKIGRAEVNLDTRELCHFFIYEAHQGNGYGQDALQKLKDDYDISCLEVAADNERAIHVYRKCGFKMRMPTLYKMERE